MRIVLLNAVTAPGVLLLAWGCAQHVEAVAIFSLVNFAAGGVATPADAALMMHLGADGVFVGSGIFKSDNPEKFARAIVEATTHYQDYKLIAEVSKNLGTPMKGIEISKLSPAERMSDRGW